MSAEEQTRKPLAEMTPQELQAWLAHRQAALESFSIDVVAPYLQKRQLRQKRRGWEDSEGTCTDRLYRAWQRESAELAQGLQELRAMFESQGQGAES